VSQGHQEEEEEAPALDVTPRARPARRRRGIAATLVLLAVVAALIVIAVNALGEASLFFLNADEAVEQQADLGDDRFRLQGTVVPGSVDQTDDGVTFTVRFNDVEVDVVHRGDPPELFQPDIPVVLEGNWEGEVYASDRILVRHESDYSPERLDQADEGGDATGDR
jgi:cytochrome c-type biogenesis protein CcmE